MREKPKCCEGCILSWGVCSLQKGFALAIRTRRVNPDKITCSSRMGIEESRDLPEEVKQKHLALLAR